MIKNVRSFLTRRNQKMAVAELEDFKGTIKLTVFSKIFEKFGHLLEEDAIVRVQGQVELKGDTPEIKVDEIKIPGELKEISFPEIHIELADIDYSEEALIDLRTCIQDLPGPGRLFLHVPENDGRTIVKASEYLALAVNDSALEQIRGNNAVMAAWKE